MKLGAFNAIPFNSAALNDGVSGDDMTVHVLPYTAPHPAFISVHDADTVVARIWLRPERVAVGQRQDPEA